MLRHVQVCRWLHYKSHSHGLDTCYTMHAYYLEDEDEQQEQGHGVNISHTGHLVSEFSR